MTASAIGSMMGKTSALVTTRAPSHADVKPIGLRCGISNQVNDGQNLRPGNHQGSIKRSSQAKKATILLEVNQESQRTQQFHGKLGFERLGTRHFLVERTLMDDYMTGRALDSLQPPPNNIGERSRNQWQLKTS